MARAVCISTPLAPRHFRPTVSYKFTKMNFFCVKPDVVGGLGEKSVLDTMVKPPKVRHLHFEFEGWPSDDLVATFPVFLVSERLATALSTSALTGFEIEQAEISRSHAFQQLHPKRKLPVFFWLKVAGAAYREDFGQTSSGDLIVSQTALRKLQEFSIENADVFDSESAPSPQDYLKQLMEEARKDAELRRSKQS